jgi:hypothetical protein
MGEAIEALREGADGERSFFLFVPESALDFATYNALIEASSARMLPLGVLPLPVDAERAGQLVARAWALARPSVRHPNRIASYCDFEREGRAPGAFGSAQSDAFVELLRAGAEGVVLHSHGNGADFRVGRHVLCLQVGAGRPAVGRADELFLPCQGGGVCRLDHKAGFVAFHGVEAVRARLLVLLSCSAYQPADGLLGARFQFTRRLLRGRHVAGVVASSRINHGTSRLGEAVARLLVRGASLGETALRINALPTGGPPSYLCLGDPDLTVPEVPEAFDAAPPTPDAVSVTHAERPSVAHPADPLFAADLARALGANDLAGRLAEAGVHAVRTPVGTALDEELLTLLGRTEPTDKGVPAWSALCEQVDQRLAGACPMCGGEAIEETWLSPLYREYRRFTTRCWRHGLLSDRPAHGADPLPEVMRDPSTGAIRWPPAPGRCAVFGDKGWSLPVDAGAGKLMLDQPGNAPLIWLRVHAGAFWRVLVRHG